MTDAIPDSVWLSRTDEDETHWIIKYVDPNGEIEIHGDICLAKCQTLYNSSADGNKKVDRIINNLKMYMESITPFGTDRPFMKTDATLPDTFDDLRQCIVSEILQKNGIDRLNVESTVLHEF